MAFVMTDQKGCLNSNDCACLTYIAMLRYHTPVTARLTLWIVKDKQWCTYFLPSDLCKLDTVTSPLVHCAYKIDTVSPACQTIQARTLHNVLEDACQHFLITTRTDEPDRGQASHQHETSWLSPCFLKLTSSRVFGMGIYVRKRHHNPQHQSCMFLSAHHPTLLFPTMAHMMHRL